MADRAFETKEYQGVAAERRLVALGLSMSGLLEVIKRGEYARAEAVAYDPITAEGNDAYRYRVRALREIFCPTGNWKADVENGLELLLSMDGARAIITKAGDDSTGIPGTRPQPKRTMGTSGAKAVSANGQALLFPNAFNVSADKRPSRDTWVLLVCRVGDIVFSELVLPSGTEEDGSFSGWIERILMPAVDFSEAPADEESGGDNNPADESPVVVRKR